MAKKSVKNYLGGNRKRSGNYLNDKAAFFWGVGLVDGEAFCSGYLLNDLG